MKILFLDDDDRRHLRFRAISGGHEVAHVRTHDQAIAALSARRFDQVWLDHDLSVRAAQRAMVGLCSGGEKTGLDVARYIAETLAAELRPKLVVIHSLNPAGGDRMLALLAAAGIATKRTSAMRREPPPVPRPHRVPGRRR